MIDENKVKLMTKLAIYEKHESMHDLIMSKYYERDYVRYNVLKTWVAATFVYWVVVCGTLFMKFDDFLAKINDIDYFGAVYKLLIFYALFAGLYFLISSALYHYRYAKGKPGLVEYNSNLRDLIEMQGGPAHVTRVKKVASSEAATEANIPARKTNTTNSESRGNVGKLAMVQKRLDEEKREKERQIVENVQKRNERVNAQKQDEARKKQAVELERQRIQKRRMELERQQMEQLRAQRQTQMTRQNYVYSQKPNGQNGFEGRDR